MKFAEKVYYCDVDSFQLSIEEAQDAGFIIEDDMIVIPAGTPFKYLTANGPAGWAVLEVFGEELDWAGEEPLKVIFN